MSENTEAGGLVKRLRDRAESYRMGGPSSEHTAAILDEAASALASERAAHAETKRDRDELKADIDSYAEASSNLATELYKTEARLAEALKALEPFSAQADNTQWWNDNTVKREHLVAARRVREGGKVDG